MNASLTPRRTTHVRRNEHAPLKRLAAAALSLGLASATAMGADIKAPKGLQKRSAALQPDFQD